TGINNPNKLQEIKKFCIYGDYECNTHGEVAFGEPSWWIEMVRRIIVSEPYVATDGRDYQSTAFWANPRTKQKSCASIKRDKIKPGLAEKFNKDIFMHGECWRFAHMFSLMVRKPTIPVWFEYADGGDHILTLCDGWFWDCTGHYLLEDLEEKGWFVSTIVNDPNVQGRSNLYRFTRIPDREPEESE
ncbi:MAG: hypothetical protein K2H85_00060, partial [Allobaculum sp.]|nr:hypothetical protein [Allobaculum sp.]